MACQGCGDTTYEYGSGFPCDCTGTAPCYACNTYCVACTDILSARFTKKSEEWCCGGYCGQPPVPTHWERLARRC